jgi:hypothetical protein
MDSILKPFGLRSTNDYPSSYKKTNSLQQRIQDSQRVLIKHPSFVPVIVDCDESLGVLNKRKYLVSEHNNVSHLLMSIRGQLKSENRGVGDKAFFLFCGNSILCPTSMMKDVYNQYLESRDKSCRNKNELSDKFLYINVVAENTFG